MRGILEEANPFSAPRLGIITPRAPPSSLPSREPAVALAKTRSDRRGPLVVRCGVGDGIACGGEGMEAAVGSNLGRRPGLVHVSVPRGLVVLEVVLDPSMDGSSKTGPYKLSRFTCQCFRE